MDIGIDLGTTFSVIAVKGRVQLVDGYPEGEFLEDFDVTIIPTPDAEATFPSVVWIDPEDEDNILVGSDAKQKAEEGEAPIMFAKRSIGTELPLKMHDRDYTAKQVAVMMLRYLKQCAEQALGQSVGRAIITHPAYFKPNQIQETREAAAEAGFSMGLPEQMMMEPAAAALAYTMGIDQDPLRVLVYDLGGGTFDITILERNQGVITLKGFDGNHLLGGYNFDSKLVQWILDKLEEAGRKIPYDSTKSEHRSRRAQMLLMAENVKEELSRKKGEKQFVNIKANNILVDEAGKKVQISERINRLQYKGLIAEELKNTIDCCHAALGKADMKIEEVHNILLVGGSTYGPWVREYVATAFNVSADPCEPDLCVAAGAAIRVAELPPPPQTAGDLRLTIDASATSILPTIIVAGKVETVEDQLPPKLELMAHLLGANGDTKDTCSLTDRGRFVFVEVELADEGQNSFIISIRDESETEKISSAFQVTYAVADEEGVAVAGPPIIQNVLPQPIYLKVAGGMQAVAEAGEQLPARPPEIKLSKLREEDTLVTIPVLLEETKVGEIRIENLPDDAGTGAIIHLDIEITQDNEMRGTATVKTPDGTQIAEAPVRVEFPPIKIPQRHVLEDLFNKLESQREQNALLTSSPEERIILGGKAKKLSRGIAKKLSGQEPDLQEIHRDVTELERLVNPPPDDMVPPRAEFLACLDRCRSMISAAGTNPELQPYQSRLERIQSEGDDAFLTKNNPKWSMANDNLAQIEQKIESVTGKDKKKEDDTPEPTLPDTPILKDHFHSEVDTTRAQLRSQREEFGSRADFNTVIKPRAEKLAVRIDQMDADINKVPDGTDPKEALPKLQMAIRPKPNIEEDIRYLDETTKKI